MAPLRTREIMVIAGVDASRRAMVDALKTCQFDYALNIHEIINVKDASLALQNNTCDCVFLHHAPPDFDALNMLQKIYKTDEVKIKSPLIIVSPLYAESVVLEFMRLNVQGYILEDNLNPSTLRIALIKSKELFELNLVRQKAEEELSHMRKMDAVGRLTSGVAHDFNNLLTVVMGNIHLLRRRFAAGIENYDPQDILGKIEAIETVADKGAELVRRLMIFTRQSPLSREVADVNYCISETFELLKRTLGEAIEIDLILSEKPWKSYLDPAEFENILINFAVNARDAMPNGGKLTIETENIFLDERYALSHPDVTPGPHVMIAISDTGVGMTADVLKNIFEPFFTTKPPGEGTGLGMSMAYGFVKQCGGYLHVYSELNHGSVFRIYLPRFIEEGEEEQTPEKIISPSGRETILVVEDDEDVRSVAVSMLTKLGYCVLQAESGREALEILKRENRSIDLLFTDIVMPGGMNGIDLVVQMREYYPQIKALFTSGYTENAIPNYNFCAGEELISKPYRRDVLATRIRKVLDGESL
jgi:signal transduction histidine kinase